MDIIRCMCNGELYGYFPVSFVSCEYRLPIGKLVEIENSHKGDVIHYLHDSFENIGDIDEILKENAYLRESRLRVWRKLTQRNYENGKLSRELEVQKQENAELSKRKGELLLEIEALKAEIANLKEKRETLASVVRSALICAEGLHVDDDCNIVDENGEIID